MIQQMKQCPTCHFTFADFQRVCAFDGAELVPYEAPQSLITVPQPPVRRRRGLKPSMSLTSLAVLAVFLSAVLIGYLKSPNPSIPAVAVQERDANSPNSTTHVSRTEEGAAESKPIARVTRVRTHLKRRGPAFRIVPEVNLAGNRSPAAPTIARQSEVPRTSRTYPPNTTLARPREVQQTSRDKSPKVVAILKTTWKVLKKPFDF